MNDEQLWTAVLTRDRESDGRFVYAVHSTGVYCRPSCPSRRPNRNQVTFFARPADAESAGFRACRRCQPAQAEREEPNLARVQEICRYLAEQHEHAPTLVELGSRFGLSPYHLQRTFKRITGVTPRQYADEQRLARFKAELKTSDSVTDAIYGAGYGSSSAAYTGAADRLGMTPASYRNGGTTAHIVYDVAPCSLGWLLVAATDKGICAVRLSDSESELVEALHNEFAAARLERDATRLGGWLGDLLAYVAGTQPRLDLPLDVQATAFQRRVWEALRAIPYGATRSYREVARAIGNPKAVRAVGGACGSNPVALVIPCHRVVREDGSLGGYRWGLARKQALLDQEARRARLGAVEGPAPAVEAKHAAH